MACEVYTGPSGNHERFWCVIVTGRHQLNFGECACYCGKRRFPAIDIHCGVALNGKNVRSMIWRKCNAIAGIDKINNVCQGKTLGANRETAVTGSAFRAQCNPRYEGMGRNSDACILRCL